MGDSDDARRRRVHMDDATRQITGADPRKAHGEDAKQSQRFQIANFVRQVYDAGYDPLVIIEMLLSGAVFIGDNTGVSRQQMAKVVVELAINENRSLIWTPR
jgi:hypothetical protein